jgi:hypothetical protein
MVCMRGRRNILRFWFGGLKGRDHWEESGVGGKLILR